MIAFMARILLLLAAAGCTSVCENAGVTVDGRGNIVVRGENGFISPNSSILRNVEQWPQPPDGEQSFAFSQGYTLARDGAMYVLANTAQHPNLVYTIDLSTGQAAPTGAGGGETPAIADLASSKETFIAADDRYAYSVDQVDPVIARADLADPGLALKPFIAGAQTRLVRPIGVAVDGGRICALESEAPLVLCYGRNARGDAAPARIVDLKRLLGYALGFDLVFDRSGRLVVSGTSDANGVTGNSIAVVDITATPKTVRIISGPNTQLSSPELGVDERGDILALQATTTMISAPHELLAFGPKQQGNATPFAVRSPAASVTHPFRLAIEAHTGDVAVLGSDGVALFRGAARRSPAQWPAEVRLPDRGWSIAFGAGSLIVADEFGKLQKHPVRGLPETTRGGTASLDDPQFIATDQNGNVYVASTGGVITRLPNAGSGAGNARVRTFATVFGRNMNAFAPDAAGYFYLSSSSNDAIVAIGPRQRQSLIEGTLTELHYPIGLAVDRDGALLVANAEGRNVLLFTRGASGNAAPAGRIEGPATQLLGPQALAIDGAGRVYVFDGPQTAGAGGAPHYVRVYGAGARGNVAPLRSYAVATKCWANAP